jgi:hypothetical protein
MAEHFLVQQHNVAPGREHEAFVWFQDALAPALLAEGITALRRYRLSDLQLVADTPQPYRYLSIFEFDPETAPGALDALSQLARKDPRSHGLISDDAGHLFRVTRAWMPSPNPADLQAPEYLLLVMGNFVPGMEDDYHRWYDEMHGPEVLDTPGFVGMRRGSRVETQTEPANDHPANAYVMASIRTEDIAGSMGEFVKRATGQSDTKIHWSYRSPAAALNRTTHVFVPLTPRITA